MILQTKSLFISAGHSDTDPGAADNGVTEADIVLEFRDMVCEELRGKLSFNRDGESGKNLPLREAARLAAAHDVAVEWHVNAATPAATGVETLSRQEHYPLGRALCEAISATLGIANRGAKPEGSGQHSRLAFCSDGGGLIVELFFLTNQGDLSSYQARKRALAAAVANVLVDFTTADGVYT